MARLSLIMPVYNAEKTISRPNKSILKQTYKDFELIIVDDGSTDKGIEIAENLLNGNSAGLKYTVLHKKNGGAASARQYGLDHSSSELVSFIDSDDALDKDFLEKLVETLDETKTNISNGRFGFSFENPLLQPISFKNRGRKLVYDTEKDKSILPAVNILTNGKVYKRDYVQFTKNLYQANEDLSRNYLMYSKARLLSFNNNVTYHYIPNDEGLVRKYIFGISWEVLRNTTGPLVELYESFEKEGLLEYYYYEVEELFIKNIFERLCFIKRNAVNDDYRKRLMTFLLDFISTYFPTWKENPYLRKYLSNLEILDVQRVVELSKFVKEYEYYHLPDNAKAIDDFGSTIAGQITPSKRKSLW